MQFSSAHYVIPFLFVCFQMDSEGEEQTLKTYQSSTGEWAFLVLDG